MRNYGIILASGTGERFDSDLPKQFVMIDGKTMLQHSVEAFELNSNIDVIILVITPDYLEKAKNIVKTSGYKKVVRILKGGKTRKESSQIAVNSIDEQDVNVLIHDCARPFVSQRIINDCISALNFNEAVCTAIPSVDTILEVQDDIIKEIPLRSNMWRAQTPQGFKLSLIKKAHNLCKHDDNFTDDCGLIVKYNLTQVFIVKGSQENMKITFPKDIFIAKALNN